MINAITTHVLDTSVGRPASGITVQLERCCADGSWLRLGEGCTGAEGRLQTGLAGDTALSPGTHRLVFQTGAYFAAQQIESFYPMVIILFEIRDPEQHHHVPLLLSPFGYSTYRGS